MNSNFNDPELFDLFMQVIDETYEQFYNEIGSDQNTNKYQKPLTRQYYKIKNEFRRLERFNQPGKIISDNLFASNLRLNDFPRPLLDQDFGFDEKQIAKNVIQHVKTEKDKAGSTDEAKDREERTEEIEEFLFISQHFDQKIAELSTLISEEARPQAVPELDQKEKSIYTDIFSVMFKG